MPKEIKLAKFAGFCYGVKRAVETVKKTKSRKPERNICVLGELIHNSQVIEELSALGIHSLKELPEKGNGICVVRSHGESPEVFKKIEDAGFEVYDLTCPDVKKVQQQAIELAKEAGLQICLDMASYNIVANDLEFFSLLISKYVDIVFANEEEARAFTGKEPKEALGMIAKKCSIAIVKVGANGSYIRKGTEEIKVSAIPVQKVVDTTGAGDYFASGFLYGLTCGYSLDKCAKIGSILSGNVIQVIGTTIPQERWDEIKLNINRILAE